MKGLFLWISLFTLTLLNGDNELITEISVADIVTYRGIESVDVDDDQPEVTGIIQSIDALEKIIIISNGLKIKIDKETQIKHEDDLFEFENLQLDSLITSKCKSLINDECQADVVFVEDINAIKPF